MRFVLILLGICGLAGAQTTQPFDGSPWNVSTGNLSVTFIQASPIGAFPRPDATEPPPAVDAMKRMKENGLVAYEDYIAWGAIELEPGKWDWTQHDAMEKAVHAAGLKYVVYNWTHFPPVWLRDQQKDDRTLMRCLEHDQETNYLSVFDPKTIEHYDRYYKSLAEHFGDKIDGVYACILGPYGEGNYPLRVPDWVNMGHCHEGYWCADAHAIKAFQDAMRKQYADIGALNRAWGTDHTSFDNIRPPKEISETFKPAPDAFKTAQDRRRWVDFITWYHQSLIDFTEKSIQAALKYFPKEIVRAKPGGNAGGVNPIAWGTYCPGYAKMAAKYGTVLQPADWHGACFGDKWIATAYHFYGVTLATEPAGGLDHNGFVKRLFSDASCGTRQLFTYEYEQHADDIKKYSHLITGQPGETETAVLCPTTLYRLGGNIQPTIETSQKLRDITDFDVLDELLITDGALKPDRYKALICFQADFIDRPILDRMEAFIRAGGMVFIAGDNPPLDLDGKPWTPDLSKSPHRLIHTGSAMINRFSTFALERNLNGYDGSPDGVWTTRRSNQTFMLNTTNRNQTANGTLIPPHEIVSVVPAAR